MLKRYLLVFLVTTWVAMLPINLDGMAAWLAGSFLSLSYIIFIWKFSKIRERYMLISIESTAMICSLVAFLQFYFPQIMSPESQWFWTNYELIMSCCFLLEIIVIITGILNSAELRRLLSVCLSYLDDDKRNHRCLLHD